MIRNLAFILSLVFITGLFTPVKAVMDGPDAENTTDVIIFPNPITNNTVSVEAKTEIEKIEIISIVGQLVYVQELEPEKSVRLNLDRIEVGVYLMRISFTDNTSATKRIWVK